jgi:hypothetical protein
MTKRTVLGVAVAAFAVIAISPSASASCTPAKTASTYVDGASSYWLPVGGVQGLANGQTWQLGAPGSWNGAGGTVPCTGFVYFSAGGANLNLDLGSCGSGCPSGPIAVLATNSTPGNTDFLLATVAETPTASVNFNYQALGNLNMFQVPRPRVTSSSRAGSVVNVEITADSVAGGLYGPSAASGISGYRILSAASVSDPGRSASSYTPLVAIGGLGGVAGSTVGTVAVDCSDNTKDRWLVTQLAFEGGQIFSEAVSAPTRVACIPTLANPTKPKVKVAPPKAAPRAGYKGGQEGRAGGRESV